MGKVLVVFSVLLNFVLGIALFLLLGYYLDRFAKKNFKLKRAKKFNKKMKKNIQPVDQKEYEETMALLKEQVRRNRIKQTKEKNNLEREKLKKTWNLTDEKAKMVEEGLFNPWDFEKENPEEGDYHYDDMKENR